MSTLTSGLWKGLCVAVAVPVLMAVAMPVRALMLDATPQRTDEVSPGMAVVKGSVTSFGSLPLPDVAVTGTDEAGNVLAMATTGPNGEFTMRVPASAGRVVIMPEGGVPAETEVEAGGAVDVKGEVPAEKVLGNVKPGWWSGMSTTSKAAIIGLPIATSAGVGFALADDGTTREASPVAP